MLQRGAPSASGGKIVGDCLAASLRGTSSVFGPVLLVESPIQHSRCEFTPDGDGGYRCAVDLRGWLWFPERRLFVFAGEPVRLEGNVPAMPPVGLEARSASRASLYDFQDPAARAVGSMGAASGRIHGEVDVTSFLGIRGTTVPALARSRARR